MRRLLFVGVVLALLAPAVSAEQPSWEALYSQLLAIRGYSGSVAAWPYAGVWSLDPRSGAWERLRPFWFNEEGDGSFLTSGNGVLRFESWPYRLEMEPGTFRIVRRGSSIADPAALGWAVQGPVLSAPEATRLGMQPGLYGFADCILAKLTGGEFHSPTLCGDYLVPGTETPVVCREESPWPLVARDGWGRLELAALEPPLEWYPEPGDHWVHPFLTLDPDRHAFWRGMPRGVEPLPIVDGHVGQPGESHQFDFPPFDDPDILLDGLFYHPARHELFVTAPGAFLSLDASLQLLQRFDFDELGSAGDLGRPKTMTWLGEPPAEQELLIPVVAHSSGRNDTFWTSELWLYNPSSAATTVHLRRVKAPSTEREVQVPPRGSLRIADVLSFAGGGPGGDGATHDALVVTSPWRWGEQLVAASRSSTPAPEGGSFGHAVTAAPGRTGYSNHLVFVGDPESYGYDWDPRDVSVHAPASAASELHLDLRQPGRFRHNLGVVNDADEPVTLTLVWGYMSNGAFFPSWLIATRPASAQQQLAVPPHSVAIVDPASLFPPEVTEVWPARVGVWGDRPVALWLSMIDNLTGDASFLPYSGVAWDASAVAHADPALRAVAPVVAHAPGVGGTTWQTDLYSALSGGNTDGVRAFLQPSNPAADCGGAGADNGIEAELLGVPLLASWPPENAEGWHTVYPDVATMIPECAGQEDLRGGLEVVAGTWLSAWTRTYTTREDGGTYGEMLPLYPLGGWPVQHFAGVEVGDRFRVNVGLFNGDHDHAITHRITLYAADGRQVAERTLTLQPLASFQRRLEHLFGLQVGSISTGTYGMTVLPLDDPANGVKGRSWAWVSLVDNVTGDPTNWW
jgi:hypothetical protein